MPRLAVPVVMLFSTVLSGGDLVPSAIVGLGIPNGMGRNSLTTDSLGNFYAAGAAQGHAVVVKVSASGEIIYSRAFGGSGLDQPQAIAVDANGAAYVVGITNSADFPLANAYLLAGNMFLLKLSPDGSTILYSTFLGKGTPVAIATDAAGNAYVTGEAASPDFQATTGVYQSKSNGPDVFILKVAADGTRAVWATFLGGNGPACAHLPGVSCAGPGVSILPNQYTDSDQGNSITVDAAGNVYVAGITNAADFPVTAGAFQTKYADPAGKANHGFVAKLSADGSALLYSTYIGTAAGEFLNALVVNGAGEAILGGQTFSNSFPATTGALAPAPHAPGGFIAKLNVEGSAFVYATYLGNGNVNAIATDGSGNLYVTGYGGLAFPVTPGAMPTGYTFFSQLDPSAASLLYSTLMPDGSAGNAVAIASSKTPAVAGHAGVLSIFCYGDATRAAVYALANAGGPYIAGQVAPGELVALFGVNLGSTSSRNPAAGASTRVSFDGVPAPVLAGQQSFLLIQVPFEVSKNSATSMQIIDSAGVSQSLSLAAVPAAPGILTIDGVHAAAINQDGSINSAQHPAALGSVITVFATGAGLWEGALGTGGISSATLISPQLPVSVLISSPGLPQSNANQHAAPVLYAGSAPTLSDGVLQINLLLPVGNDLANGPEVRLVLEVGESQAPAAAIAVPYR